MIYNMVHSEQDAWDLAQESFIKAWKSIGRFRGQSSFYTWIYRIVMNVTIDWLRKKKIKGGDAEFDDAIQLREIDPASKTVPKTEALPHQAMERDEIRARIGTPRRDFNEGNRRYAISRDRGSVGVFDWHRDVPAVLCAEEIAKLTERRL
jgi:RNA polymerase sigma-70 factor (ECF subfamily)